MSFALTTDQIRNRTKTVTRRMGWTFLRPGDLVQPVVKAQGLKKGEAVEKIGGPIRIENVRRCSLAGMPGGDPAREGFPDLSVEEFVAMFCREMRPCEPSWQVTRIEFSYVGDEAPTP